jgi:serine/threonine protein phosphatase 1
MAEGAAPAGVPVAVSEWKAAPFALGGETVFAVGDVHGCAGELRALLGAIRSAAAECRSPTRLIYLGDMIDRGPDNLGVLDTWAENEAARGVGRIDRLMGNHEQLLLLAIGDGPHAEKAEATWRSQSMGGEKMLDEMRAKAHRPDARPGVALAEAALGVRILDRLRAAAAHVAIGNTLFVHGGLDPAEDQDAFLARPWTDFTAARWCWIQQGFLDWRGGFGGRLVVHGHTPPPKHRALTGQDDPHLFLHDRLGLDGGSALSGIVAAAEIGDGRYRIFRAGRPVAG